MSFTIPEMSATTFAVRLAVNRFIVSNSVKFTWLSLPLFDGVELYFIWEALCTE